MNLQRKVVVVTGGGSGIGRALCLRFATEGAQAIVVADINRESAKSVASDVNGLAATVNVAVEDEVKALVTRVVEAYGRVDAYCSNAGVAFGGGAEASDDAWRQSWDVNVMAHVYAARAVVPGMLERGEGYIVGTVSAAGLLNHVQAAPYSATKAAALSFFEWLSIAYGDEGIRVSAICPQGVKTPMLAQGGEKGFLQAGALEPEEVADAVVVGMREERFLILPHPEVSEYFQRKATDYDRWLRGMRRLRRKVIG
jgi:NAD(P)-dependent dehydrogenase (short-subunit alcohol dehydrogenase family)